MTCYRPQPAYQNFHFGQWSQPRIIYPTRVLAGGVREYPRFFGDFSDIQTKKPRQRLITLPCGLCFGCRCDNSRSWSLRMMHEQRYHDETYFITLTYAPEYLPPDGNLRYKDLQNFMKRARHEFQSPSQPFKYFACGEYGDKNLRPHFHFASYSFRISDLRPLPNSKNGQYFISESLRDCWQYGHVVVAPLEWQSAAYIARYVTKKMHGGNMRYLDTFDPLTGEVDVYNHERASQSKGLGKSFYHQHFDEIWANDGCLFNRKYMVKPPRYYMKLLEDENPEWAAAVKESRRKEVPDLRLDVERDRELLYIMDAKKFHMQTLLSRNL